MPRLSVVVPNTGLAQTAGIDLERAVHTLRGQTMGEWQAILAGGAPDDGVRALIQGDARFVVVEHPGTWAAAVNAGLAAATGEFVTVLDPRDVLMPRAFELLLATAERGAKDGGVAGAAGKFVFTSPLGVMPGDPMRDKAGANTGGTSAGGTGGVERTLGLAGLLDCKLFPLHAMIVRREALAGLWMQATPEMAGDHDLLLRLAESGVRWALCDEVVATAAMDGPKPARSVLVQIAAHVFVMEQAWRRASGAAGRPGAAEWNLHSRPGLRSLVEAFILLRSFDDEMQAGAARADRATMLWTRVQFSNLFAGWWQRCRFYGRPPRHAFAASGGIDQSALGTPRRIAMALLSQCERERPVVLLGLGRNARQVALVMRELGLPIVGRDDGLTAPPAWAEADWVNVDLLPAWAPWDRNAQYIMTPASDEEFLRRIPPGLAVLRWSQTPGKMMEDYLATAAGAIASGDLEFEVPEPSGGVLGLPQRGAGKAAQPVAGVPA